MNNYQAPKTTRQVIQKKLYQPCISERPFYNNNLQEYSQSTRRLTLKKSTSCETLPNQFAQTLINKMRKVPRPSTNLNKLQQVSQKLVHANLKLQKSKQKLQTYKQSFIPAQIKIYKTGSRNDDKQLCLQIARLRNELSELTRQNNRLFSQIKELECSLFYERQKIELLAAELQNKNHLIQQLQEQISFYSKRNSKSSLRKEATHLSIHKAIQQLVLASPSSQKIALLKANAEIMNLRKQIISIQKQYEGKYSQLNNRKNDEIQQIRKGFSETIKHYKKMIIKFTSKKTNELSKEKEESQSTLLQNSSILQI